jgi:hypothetical protein
MAADYTASHLAMPKVAPISVATIVWSSASKKDAQHHTQHDQLLGALAQVRYVVNPSCAHFRRGRSHMPVIPF